MSVYKSAYVLSVDNVEVVYRLPWILAVVGLMPFLVTPLPSNGALIGFQRVAWLAL